MLLYSIEKRWCLEMLNDEQVEELNIFGVEYLRKKERDFNNLTVEFDFATYIVSKYSMSDEKVSESAMKRDFIDYDNEKEIFEKIIHDFLKRKSIF